ncbi:hypothetical protein DINM_004611 [Dirofilaria immitis]|nr:hypothetical protein [Dirofilaria immitis]
MVLITYLLSAFMLLSIPLISSTNAAIYNPRRIVLPADEEIQREMINDLLQREYADRYRDYIEKGLAALSRAIWMISMHCIQTTNEVKHLLDLVNDLNLLFVLVAEIMMITTNNDNNNNCYQTSNC